MRIFKSKWFAKNEQDNIDESDEREFKILAAILLAASDTELDILEVHGEYVEIECDDQN